MMFRRIHGALRRGWGKPFAFHLHSIMSTFKRKHISGLFWLGLIACCGAVGVVQAQNLEDRVTVRKLKNGLTVIFAERHEAPTFSAIYGFKVGAVDEVPGITGLAHLFEHMAFKGTPRIGTSDFEKEKPLLEEGNRVGRDLSLELLKGDAANDANLKSLKERLAQLDGRQKQYIVKDEIDRIYKEAGGVGLNASTGKDQTQYYISLPANRFELFCLVESERMKNAVLREFYTERTSCRRNASRQPRRCRPGCSVRPSWPPRLPRTPTRIPSSGGRPTSGR